MVPHYYHISRHVGISGLQEALHCVQPAKRLLLPQLRLACSAHMHHNISKAWLEHLGRQHEQGWQRLLYLLHLLLLVLLHEGVSLLKQL
jgi:hypothetical protein